MVKRFLHRIVCLFLCAVLLLGVSDFFTVPSVAAGTVNPSVSVGNAFMVALDARGVLRAWGVNTRGTLGNGTTIDSSVPVEVTHPDQLYFQQVSAGFDHVLALGSDGNVYAWGSNEYGQLGWEGSSDVLVPTLVTALSNQKIVALAAGARYSLALTENGEVYAWGDNRNCQLGISADTVSYRHTPMRIADDTLAASFTVGIYAGPSTAAAISSDGSVLLWGDNSSRQAGIDNVLNSTPAKPSSTKFPTVPVKSVALGAKYSMFYFDESTVGFVGYEQYDQYGNGENEATTPTHVFKGATLTGCAVSAIAASDTQTVFLGNDGVVYTAGQALVTGEPSAKQTLPTPLSFGQNGLTVSAVSAGYQNGAAIGVDGSVWTWGNNDAGQLGNGTTVSTATPVEVKDAEGNALVLGSSPYVQSVPMLFRATVPAPTFAIQIPERITIENLYQQSADAEESVRYATKDFEVTASNVANLFGEKQVVVRISSPDGSFALVDAASSNVLPYEVYNKNVSNAALESGDILATFTENGTATAQIRVDQSLIHKSGNYSDTVHFEFTLVDITE